MKGTGNPQRLQWGFGAAEICSSSTYILLVPTQGDPHVSGFCFALCGANMLGLWVVMADVPKLGSGALERDAPMWVAWWSGCCDSWGKRWWSQVSHRRPGGCPHHLGNELVILSPVPSVWHYCPMPQPRQAQG